MNVRLHIERLVLDGFAMTPAERSHLVGAAEQELTRLLEQRGLPAEAARAPATPALDGGTIARPAGQLDPRAFGRELARAVYGSLGKGGT